MHRKEFTNLRKTLNKTQKQKRMLVICGSFYMMSDIKEILKIEQEKDLLELNEIK